MSKPKVAVLGSANMDLVVTVERAPQLGETVTGKTFHTVPGGKGANQALAAARAGGDVTFLGAVGADAHGYEIRALLAADGISIDGLRTVDDPTGTAHIVVDAVGGNSIVVVPGANGTVIELTDEHRAVIADADVLLLQLELPPPVVLEAAEFARSVETWTVLTPAPAEGFPPDLRHYVDIYVPNEHELTYLGGHEDLLTSARQIAGRTQTVLVTLGDRGVMLVHRDDVVEAPAFEVNAVDTTAAGDTFVGVYAISFLESDWNQAAAMRRASAAAALSVQRLGASSSMPYRDEIDAFLAAHPE